MPETLYIGNDINTARMEVLFSEQDFLNAVECEMGPDSRAYVEAIIVQRDNAQKELNILLRDGGYDGGYQDGFDAGLAAAEEY